MEAVDFWRFLELSAVETTGPQQRLEWLDHRLGRLSRRARLFPRRRL